MQELTFEQVEVVSGGFPGLTGPEYITERIMNFFEGTAGYFSTAGFVDNNGGSYTEQCSAVRDFTTNEKAFLNAFFAYAGALVGGAFGAAAGTFFQTLVTDSGRGGCIPEVPDFIAP